MQKQIEQVKEFMTVMGQEVKTEIEMPTDSIAQLRVRLLREEVEELQEAIDKGDMVGVLDAFTDIRYVLEGAILAFGMQNIVEEAFDRVHASNMLKVCANEQVARDTVNKYNKEGIDVVVSAVGDYFVVKRKSDNKVLKSVEWVEQDLASLL